MLDDETYYHKSAVCLQNCFLAVAMTKTPKTNFFRVKLLPKIIFWNFFTPTIRLFQQDFKIEDFEFFVDIFANK